MRSIAAICFCDNSARHEASWLRLLRRQLLACLRAHQITGIVSHRKTMKRTIQLGVDKYAITAIAIKNAAQAHRGVTTALLITCPYPVPTSSSQALLGIRSNDIYDHS